MATYRKRGQTWQVRVRIAGRAATATFRTKAQCERWAQKKEDELKTGYADTTLLCDLLQKYQDTFTDRKRSVKSEQSRIKILRKELGSIPATEVTAERIIDYIQARGVASETIRRELSTLSLVFKAAKVMWKVPIKENPVTVAREILSVTAMLEPAPSREVRVTDADLETLLAVTRSRLLPYIVWFAVLTGMRRSEIVGLTRSSIVGRYALIRDAKTGNNQRVPLSNAALELLASVPTKGDRYFPMRGDAVTRAFNYARKRTGVNARFHDLRHEATSRFFEMGLSLEQVGLITRHADWKMLKRYTHLQPSRVLTKLDAPDALQPTARPLIASSPPGRRE